MTAIPITATLTEPLHHGAGTAGNTSLLRTQDIVLPGGRHALVPFVSGNSLRHLLRDALAWSIVDTLAVPDQSLHKQVVDLLWSGGAITSTGAETDLGMRRAVDDVLPSLALLGYAAGADIIAGTYYSPNLHLVCSENAWRLPPPWRDHPLAARGAGSYRGEEFGTRHDVSGTAVDRYVAMLGDITAPKTTQMIYDVQVIKPGAVLTGVAHVTAAATLDQQTVLAAAWDLAAPAGPDAVRTTHLGAKSATGYGTCRLDIDLSGLSTHPDPLTWWHEHLAGRADEVVPLLDRLAR
ncbi:hypothetical protein [Mycobacterium ostraviense]|uniref:Uncharacterized protein n=1 Tax=Mycobacterium ostraviense TaxID=2738409 RepID=A0A164B4P8_9MYCO|nr:hypothetical protein [Mycobacterium ostraviense]KZS63116.1 hypothetical protein A4G28_04595 [Mycobacterium ostraviense]